MSKINEIKNNLKNLKTLEDVFLYINSEEKDWITDICDNFSDDYPHLTMNWNFLVKKINLEPQKIILVNKFDTDTKILFSDLLFTSGFILKSNEDYSKCPTCNKVIPKLNIYNMIQEKKESENLNVSIPDEWRHTCSRC